MTKRYQIKVYELDWTFKQTIKENVVLSDISFNENINSWQSELDILLNLPFNYSEIDKNDFIRVTLFDDNFPNGRLVYTWVIEEINRLYRASENKIELVCRSLSSLLTRILYKDGWTSIFNKNDDPWNIIKDIISYFNSVYPWNWLNDTWVQTFWSTFSVDFDKNTCLDALRIVTNLTDFYFFINESGTVIFKAKESNNEHFFITNAQEGTVDSLEITEDSSELVNDIQVNYNGWIYSVSDAVSIANNWRYEKIYSHLFIVVIWFSYY